MRCGCAMPCLWFGLTKGMIALLLASPPLGGWCGMRREEHQACTCWLIVGVGEEPVRDGTIIIQAQLRNSNLVAAVAKGRLRLSAKFEPNRIVIERTDGTLIGPCAQSCDLPCSGEPYSW